MSSSVASLDVLADDEVTLEISRAVTHSLLAHRTNDVEFLVNLKVLPESGTQVFKIVPSALHYFEFF